MTDPTGGWAAATEKASEAVSDVVHAAQATGRFWSPALGQLVGMAEDQLTVWRAKRRVRLTESFGRFLRQRGLSGATREISPAFMLPLIDRATIEPDDGLQDVWAMMLANAADRDCQAEIRTAFVSMLAEMTHLDVQNLAKLAEAVERPGTSGIYRTSGLPAVASEDRSDGTATTPPADVLVSLSNLGRLGCVQPLTGFGGWGSFSLVTVTPLGRAFAAACRAPRS